MSETWREVLRSAVRAQAMSLANWRADVLANDIDRLTESPIEALFAASLMQFRPDWNDVGIVLREWEGAPIDANTLREHARHVRHGISEEWPFICVYPQVSIGRWRVDFLMVGSTFPLLALGKSRQVIIECDGHDFHDRTKEQAERDRSRDRDLQSMGFSVFRFTGAELYRDAVTCGSQAVNFLLSGIKKDGGDVGDAIGGSR